ncbi:splicing factor 3A subunit 3-like protein [Dimargaris cristalligena]|uniref:Splicing factor 3A subunit 3-like protein n=1 Tax=Dimargaris cristalligena TaxID=215637 RepID=A0A4Q0A4A6_9FUNG|nr:splicing factor 3A subunit 3-like protein [Dimargaris cristalligena]|eukprot:RKP40232.1 splicing factor 3A subunit 3-like protein [Dimargaris cristalligena]
METLLEQQRHQHEEIERIEKAIVQLYLSDANTTKQKLNRDHAINDYIGRIHQISQDIHKRYTDLEGPYEAEVKRLREPGEFDRFYDQLKGVLDHHKRYPDEPVEPMELRFIRDKENRERQEENEETVVDRVFSGEEGAGKYLDLHELFDKYINLKDVPKLDYLTYISEMDHFATIPRSHKKQAYRDYLAALNEYLHNYFARAMPLFDVAAFTKEAEADFATRWERDQIPGWTSDQSNGEGEETSLDLRATAHLYCLPCHKQYAKQTVFDAHLKSRKHAKAVQTFAAQKSITPAAAAAAVATDRVDPAEIRRAQRASEQEQRTKDRAVAWLETLITKALEVLSEKREDTRANIERKQALTEEERNAEFQEDDIDVDQYESDEEDQIYNPLKLPLGWDGKPIPYWLYKLHGLGVNYTCEICGNYVYRGRKAFDKHFAEWRHAHGLRCLGITSPAHMRQFAGITHIEEATDLRDRIKADRKVESTQVELMEEFEDNEGNGYNKKTFEDLKRQGLL